LRLETLAFCGSVLRNDFPPDILLRQVDDRKFVNDCGNKDWWPLIAARITWGFGDTGRHGFQLIANDRYHNCGHSGFFTEDFIRRYWHSLFVNREVVKADPPKEPNWFNKILLWFPLRWLFLLLLLFVLAYCSLRVLPWVSSLFTVMGLEFSSPLVWRHDYTLDVVPINSHYAIEQDVGLVPKNSPGTIDPDIVQAMFCWKKWMHKAAKPPDGDFSKALVVVWSDTEFGRSYFTFDCAVTVGDGWRIVDGCAFLVHDRLSTGQHRPTLRQMDLQIPYNVLDHASLQVLKPDADDKLMLVLQIEPSKDDKRPIPREAAGFNVQVKRR
jgi:hypothetical protein